MGSTGVPATANVSFTYGTDKTQNNNGRVITMSDGVGSETYSYDTNLSLVTQVQKVISGTTYTTQYQYNLAGEAKQIQYPSGRKVQPTYDAIGRLATVADTMGSVNTTYANGFSYNVAQQVTAFNYGNGVAANFSYSADRLQLTSLSYAKGAQTLFSLSYGYTQGSGNNGQITGVTDNVDATRSMKYTYDALYRLAVAQAGPDATPTWKLGFTYDRYGNRTDQSLLAGPSAPTNHVTINANTNRITDTGYSYDVNGNMTNDGQNTLVYDAENHAVSGTTNGTTSTYTYDGNGLRVQKQVGSATATVYIFSGTKVIAEYASGAAVGSPTKEYIYSGGALLATISGSTTTYHHADHLSVRLTTDTSGNSAGQQGHFPFGELWYPQPPPNPATKWQFTTYERDAGTNESGNDYAMARYHVNRLGRFNSADPVAGSLGNPQSLNRYAYVRNDPGNLTDPTGLDVADDNPGYCPPSELNCGSFNWMFNGGGGWGDSLGFGGGGGFAPAATEEFAQGLARYNSIRTTGYDPEFGIFWGTYEITSTRGNGSSVSQTLINPTLSAMGAAINSGAVWASGTSPYIFSQFPPAAAAGAAGAGTFSVTVTWIGTTGATIGAGTLLVAGGVVVGVAALAVGGYYAWQYFSRRNREQAAVAEAARQAGITYQQFFEYLHR